MNIFKQDIDVKAGVEIAYKVMKGMSEPNFDQGTGIARRFGITNITFSEDCSLGTIFRSAKLNFSLEDCDVEAELLFNNFSINKKNKVKSPAYEQTFSKEEILYELTGDKLKDKDKIENMIKQMSQESPSLFKREEKESRFSKFISLGSGETYCFDKDLARLFFELVGKQLQFISTTENILIKKMLLLNDEPVRVQTIENVMNDEFNQTFKVLKEKGYSIESIFDFNDMDNKIYFVEKENYEGVVYETQNHMFFIAKNKETNVIKAWTSMEIKQDWFEYLSENLKYENNTFDVAKYLTEYVGCHYFHKFEYPFVFKNDFYRKDVNSILNLFDTLKSNLIYNSEYGFMPQMSNFFNSLVDTVSYSHEVITDEQEA